MGQIDGYAGELPVAYVTVNSGFTFDEGELIEYLRGQIAERAAVPVRIEAIEEMPTTTVGKIFKPALRSRAAEFVVNSALLSNAVPLDSLHVFQDPKYGLSAKIAVSDPIAKETAQSLIGQYAIHTDISSPA